METTKGLYSDLEGPLVKADHAAALLDKGIFNILSLYDDIKFFLVHAEGYNPGNTLMLITPLLHALGKDEAFLREKSEELGTTYIKGARNLCQSVPIRIISTSYHQYVHHVTGEGYLNVDVSDVYCTEFPLNNLTQDVKQEDKECVLEFIESLKGINSDEFTLGSLESRINNLNSLIGRFYLSFDDLPDETKEIYNMIDEFYNNLLKSSYAPLLKTVKPCGGVKKYEALCKALEKDNNTLETAFVIGDSITDCVMLDETRKTGGLAVSFNGNRYCLLSSEIAIFSDNCHVTKALYDLFVKEGKESVLKLAETWNKSVVRDFLGEETVKLLTSEHPVICNGMDHDFPLVFKLTNENRKDIITNFEKYRRAIRGKSFGSLG